MVCHDALVTQRFAIAPCVTLCVNAPALMFHKLQELFHKVVVTPYIWRLKYNISRYPGRPVATQYTTTLPCTSFHILLWNRMNNSPAFTEAVSELLFTRA